jgi:photosystem II stability/assembly factor-like uncharacterized protein
MALSFRSIAVVTFGMVLAEAGPGQPTAAGAQTTAWRPLASGPPAIEAPVGLCPGDPGLVYIGTFGGGVLRSRDEGRTFQPANTGLTTLAVTALAVDPVHCEIVYAGTFSGGIFRTQDSGRTWASVAGPNPLWLAIDPRRPNILYAGLLGGDLVVKTVDSGATWQPANRGLPAASVWTIQIDREEPDVLYLGTSGAGAFKSTDGGGSWTAMPVGPIVWSLALDPRRRDTIYAGTNGDGVYRSDDGGTSFHKMGSPGDGIVLALAHDPGRRGLVYAGTAGGGVAVSHDFGVTFTTTALGGSLTLALAIHDTGDVYAATGNDGVLASGSYGAVWRPVAAAPLGAITAQNIYGLAVDPAAPSRVIAATNDGGLIGSSDAGDTWSRQGTGFASRSSRQITFDPTDRRRIYAGAFIGGGVQVSTDSGATWTTRRVGPNTSYVWSTAVDRRSGAVFAGTVGQGLWRSTNGATTFTPLGESVITDNRSVLADGDRILAGGRQGLHRSTDGGITWTQTATAFINNLTVDPRDANLVYAATQTGVLRSRDGGVTFTAINAGLTVLRTSRGSSVLVDPRDSATLYVGTEGAGVFKSTDGGQSWRSVSQGLANLNVFALALDPANPDVLYAGGASGVFKTTTGGEPR